MDKVEQVAEKGGPWLTVEEALQATGGLPFTQEDRGRATQWLDENCHLVRHWTLPKILAAYAAQVTAEKVEQLVDALRGLLDCPAIADGDLSHQEWGCYESALAERKAREALKQFGEG